ncbi:hypothetical protein [Hymenobacter sp.]|uniref:hypothetical protein n=1 Tax=Hymenobacter sp. TaxID=1898978 RepID=UPI00286D5D71|nr:hypothetical protein [Hymenobacter sp.]
MRNLLLLLTLSLLGTGAARAHGGDDHGTGAAATAAGATSFSTHALSETFEVLLRYAPLEAGRPAHLRLFVADYATNAPVPAAVITLTTPEDAQLKWTVQAVEPGIYEVEGQFPANKKYSFTTNIVAGSRADLLLLEGVEVGKKLPVATAPVAAPSFFSSGKNLLLLAGAFAAGIAVAALLLRRRAASTPTPISTPAAYENHA